MPYKPHYRVRVSGVFANDADNPYEIWSWGFQYGSPAAVVPPVDPPGTWAAEMRALITAYHSDGAARIASQCRLTEVKISAIDASGHVRISDADGSYLQSVFSFSAEDLPGGGGGLLHPPQVAQCVTLRGNRAGRHGRGRFYLPGPTSAVTGEGVTSTANRDSVVLRTAQLINDINELEDNANAVIVAGSDGDSTYVNAVFAGIVLDTQRRRRNAMGELKIGATITP